MDVVVVGSCNMDLMSYIPQLPVKGQTIHGSKFVTGFGGKGANQCVMAAKLGAQTAMVAKVGEDAYGQGFIKEFQRLEVNTDYIFKSSEASTGVAPGFVDKDGNSAIVIISGTNLLLTPEEINRAEPLISKAKVLICQLEITEAATLAALKLAKKHGVTTILNPAPKMEDLTEEVYPVCDIFCPNETEAADKPVESIEEAGKAAISYVEKGCKTVIVTLGEKGCVFVTKEDQEVKHVPCEKVKAVDATGAGDSFVGSLAYFIAKKPELSLEEQIRRASYIATQSVRKEGTQTSYPTKSELPSSLFE